MGRFGAAERADFLAIKSACYRGLRSAELLAYVGERLKGSLRADATCMVQLDPMVSLPVFSVSQGWSSDAHLLLIDNALLASPTADPPALIAQERRTVAVDELVPNDRPYQQDPYFAHHILWGGYRYELQTACRSGHRGRAFLTLSRRAATGSFEPRHFRLLDAVAPHVAAGVHAALVREALAAEPASQIGLIVLDEAGKVQFGNLAGERWLSRIDVLGQSGYSWAVHLLAHLLKHSLTANGATELPMLELNDPAGRLAHRLHAERVVGANGDKRTVVLVEPIGALDRPESLHRLGLTERESEVAFGLLRFGTVGALARDLGCSPHTVVHHQRRVFEKLGISSRRALMAKLYSGFARVKAEASSDENPTWP